MENNLDVAITSEEILKQNNEEISSSKSKTNYDKNNYLDVSLKEGEKTKSVRIRLLPFSTNGGTPFKKIKMHSLKQQDGKWKFYVCPNQTGLEGIERSKCPFCELSKNSYDLAEKETDEVKKKYYKDIAFNNMAKDYWMVRCIDRADEEYGPKFWRFSSSAKKHDGVYDKMINLFKIRAEEDKDFNIFSLKDGKDMIVTITRGEDNKKTVTITDAGKVTPLSNDMEKAESWVKDPKGWSDVFGGAKSFEYLLIAVSGKTPIFDKAEGKWKPMLSKEEFEAKKAEQAAAQSDEVPDLTGKIDNTASISHAPQDANIPCGNITSTKSTPYQMIMEGSTEKQNDDVAPIGEADGLPF